MEFPDLGKHCELKSCRQLDFCPFQCTYCKKWFCKDHRSQHEHYCEELKKPKPVAPVVSAPTTSIYNHSCDVPNCKNMSIVPHYCYTCGNNFCVFHRLHMNHETKIPNQNRKNKP